MRQLVTESLQDCEERFEKSISTIEGAKAKLNELSKAQSQKIKIRTTEYFAKTELRLNQVEKDIYDYAQLV